jgi:predicted alpha-1,2-mannosidase
MKKNKWGWIVFLVLGISHGGAQSLKEPVDYVDPWIDSANSRWFFFSSACRPFGMINLSPDTQLDGAWNSGYRYNETFIHGFSHIHAWQLSGIPVMPVTGEFDPTVGSALYGSNFDHADEVVAPGYHKVYLKDHKITAELTSTTRVGFHRYTTEDDIPLHVLFNLGAELGPSDMVDCLSRQVNNREIEGYVTAKGTRRRPKDTRIYFVAFFDKPMLGFRCWDGSKTLMYETDIQGDDIGVWLTFDSSRDRVLQIKVAISYVSIDQARRNLQTECPHWNFDRVRQDSRRIWNEWLSKVRVEGGTEAQKIKFYTDLWHSILGRRIVSDVNGMYCDMTGDEPVTRQIPLDEWGNPEYHHYNSDSFWGAQWTLNTLWSLVYPRVASEFTRCFLDYYDNGGLIPRGPSGGNYTFVMTSAQTTPFIVSNYMKGIRDFDIDKAYEGMRKNHFPGGLMSKAGYEHESSEGGGIEYYIERGYIPLGIKARAFHVSGAGQTLEYAYNDWCLAQMAKALGKADDYELFMQRARNYRNLYDKESGYMRPRMMDGSWITPFDPADRTGFVESNAYQATWYVPHDVAGLIELMGGSNVFNNKLNIAFEQAEPHRFVSSHGEYDDYLNYGNQPATQVGHLFNYSGAPWLTQEWIRRVNELAFGGITPDSGYNDDEDQGLMGSLSALMSIGLFQMRGGADIRPIYELSSPVFDRIVIELDPDYYPGNTFEINVSNNSDSTVYIQSARLNGVELNKAWFYHDELVQGGTLELELGPTPNKEWASDPQAAPPSMSTEIGD